MGFKTIVAGSRKFINKELIHKILDDHRSMIDEVVSGQARGVDTIGEEWAKSLGIPVVPFEARWKDVSVPGAVVRYNQYGPYNAAAGHMRNELMSNYGEMLILIWDGVSSGSRDMLDRAKARGMKIVNVVMSIDRIYSVTYIDPNMPKKLNKTPTNFA